MGVVDEDGRGNGGAIACAVGVPDVPGAGLVGEGVDVVDFLHAREGGLGVAAGGLGAASGQAGSRESVTMPGGFSTPQQSFSSPEGTGSDGAAPTRKRVISFDLSGSAPPTPGRVSRKSSFARLRGMLSGSKDETQPLASAKH